MGDEVRTALILGGVAVVGLIAYFVYRALKPSADAAKEFLDVGAGIGKNINDTFDGLQNDLAGANRWAGDRLAGIGNFFNQFGPTPSVNAPSIKAVPLGEAGFTPTQILEAHATLSNEGTNLPAELRRIARRDFAPQTA